MTSMNSYLVLAAATVLLAACGGGGQDNAGAAPSEDPLARVPASAQASVAGMVDFLEWLGNRKVNDREPMSLDGVTLPVSDNAESVAVVP